MLIRPQAVTLGLLLPTPRSCQAELSEMGQFLECRSFAAEAGAGPGKPRSGWCPLVATGPGRLLPAWRKGARRKVCCLAALQLGPLSAVSRDVKVYVGVHWHRSGGPVPNMGKGARRSGSLHGSCFHPHWNLGSSPGSRVPSCSHEKQGPEKP